MAPMQRKRSAAAQRNLDLLEERRAAAAGWGGGADMFGARRPPPSNAAGKAMRRLGVVAEYCKALLLSLRAPGEQECLSPSSAQESALLIGWPS